MLPLLDKTKSSNSDISVEDNKWKHVGKLLRIAFILIFLISISIILYYFNSGSIKVDNNNNISNNIINKNSESTTTSYYTSSGSDDVILTMPNLDLSTCSSSITNCEFKQYSGYLLANNNAEIHYWFIQADTMDDPTTKPLFFWTNGGPGCSGMDGLLTEHGPWRVADNLDIHYNAYSWNNEVNMVYIEQPYGVGFSEVSDNDNVVAGDQNAANDIDAIIRNFLIKFPDYADTPIYLSSESWGGHYVPMTTYTILQNNDAGSSPYINFAGFLLGNPYTDWYENTYGFVGDVYGHGLMMSKDWDEWRANCWDNEYNIDNDAICSSIYTRAYISSYNANVYALDWPQCIFDEDWSIGNIPNWKYQKSAHLHEHAKRFIKRVLDYENYQELNMKMDKNELMDIYNKLNNKEEIMHNNKDVINKHTEDGYTTSSDEYLPCIEYNMANWLNLDEVQSALNVKPLSWGMCSDPVWNAWPDTDYDSFMQTYYTNIIDNYSTKYQLKLSIYSGDDDSVCGLQGTQYWLDRYDGVEVNENIQWNPWQDDNNELGGYYTQYMIKGDNNNVALHFITVRSAGHMVPTTQPQRALTLLRKYLYDF